MKKLFFFIYILSFSGLFAGAADSLSQKPGTPFIVDSITVTGNDITKEYIILRELTFAPGDTVDTEMLKFNRERVYSTGIFNQVNVYGEVQESKNVVIIDVKESWYIYPLPFLTIRENSFKKSSYGMNLIYKNFRGRNETIRALVSLGYDPSYGLSYFNPLINYEHDLSLGFGFSYSSVLNKSKEAELYFGDEFEYDFFGFSLDIGKRIDQFNTVYALYDFRYIKAPERAAGFNASGTTIDRINTIGLNYVYDSRDLAQYATHGIYSSVALLRSGIGIYKDVDYNIFLGEFRHYSRLSERLRLKWRIADRNAFGRKIPSYDLSYFGYDEYVRGHRFDKKEGNHYFLGSLELDYPVIEEWNISLDLPVLPKRLTSARLAFHISLFTDSGILYNKAKNISFGEFDSGYGIGLIMLVLPHNAFRLEYAFDEYKNGELLFGTGFSF